MGPKDWPRARRPVSRPTAVGNLRDCRSSCCECQFCSPRILACEVPSGTADHRTFSSGSESSLLRAPIYHQSNIGARMSSPARYDIESLSNLERLILAQAVYEFGSNKWDNVSTILSTHSMLHRPKNYFTPEVSIASFAPRVRIPTEAVTYLYRLVINSFLLL